MKRNASASTKSDARIGLGTVSAYRRIHARFLNSGKSALCTTPDKSHFFTPNAVFEGSRLGRIGCSAEAWIGAGTPREWNNLGQATFLFFWELFVGSRRRPRPCRNLLFGFRPVRPINSSVTPRRRVATKTTGC